MSESENQALDIADMPLTITANYADHFTDANGVIDPNTVFAWYDPAASVAFGDGSNDAEMLEAAGLGVAMANACDEVLAAADRVALSNEEAGVGRMIEELLREQEAEK